MKMKVNMTGQHLLKDTFSTATGNRCDIYVQVDGPSSDGIAIHDYGEGRGQREIDFVDKSMTFIRAFAEKLGASVRDINNTCAPDELAVEFGVTFNAQVGVIFAKASSESHLKVCLKWNGKT